MISAPCVRRLAGRGTLVGSIGRVTAVVLAVPALMLAACGGSREPTAIIETVVDTSTLVGSWKGTVNGAEYGNSTITYLLNADSTMSGEAVSSLYGKVSGTWTTSPSQIRMTFRDRDGVIITSVAPFDKRRMLGTWSASSGKVGTFNVSKEPTP
jgi:hypothetical protein